MVQDFGPPILPVVAERGQRAGRALIESIA